MSETLESLVDKASYESLMKTNPGLITAISQLLAAGQTPAQIERHVKGRTKAGPMLVAAVRGAAEYLKANRNVQ